MKKLFVVFLFLVLSILSGCKGKTDIDDSLIEKIALFNVESNYSEMYEEYKIITIIIIHKDIGFVKRYGLRQKVAGFLPRPFYTSHLNTVRLFFKNSA